MTKTLTTNRLTLRPVTSGGDYDFYTLCSDAQAMRYLPSPPHSSAAETAAWIASKITLEDAYLWAIFLKEGEQPIGFVNYLGGTRIPGMGYIIHPDYWGQGIAPEACRAALDYGFAHLGLDRVELWIDETNAPSHRVAQKLGFAVKGRVPVKFSHQPVYHYMLVYGMRAETWRAGLAPAVQAKTEIFRVEPVLAVRDVGQAAVFYRDQLGFAIDFLYGDPPIHAAVSRGEWTGSGATIQLTQAEQGEQQPPAGFLYLFTDTTIDALCSAYRERGVPIISEPQERPWGMREFAIRDLDGNLLNFSASI